MAVDADNLTVSSGRGKSMGNNNEKGLEDGGRKGGMIDAWAVSAGDNLKPELSGV